MASLTSSRRALFTGKILFFSLVLISLHGFSNNAYADEVRANSIYSRALLSDFFRIAIGAEYSVSNTGKVNGTISKWTTGINFFILGHRSKSEINSIRKYLQFLSKITGLSIQETDVHNDASLKYIILNQQNRLRLMVRTKNIRRKKLFNQFLENDDLPCIFLVRTGDEGDIEEANIYIKKELSTRWFSRCVWEETPQILGLFNDNDEIEDSIFNDDQKYEKMTEKDKSLLSLLYDKRIRSAMTREDVLEALNVK